MVDSCLSLMRILKRPPAPQDPPVESSRLAQLAEHQLRLRPVDAVVGVHAVERRVRLAEAARRRAKRGDEARAAAARGPSREVRDSFLFRAHSFPPGTRFEGEREGKIPFLWDAPRPSSIAGVVKFVAATVVKEYLL